MSYKFFTLASVFLTVLFLFGTSQEPNTNHVDVPNLISKSPEAAGLTGYGAIDIGEYTGTPNISLPIYTVESGSIKVPISLNYDATGIKVNQEATHVGLGWNLIAGGSINYIPVGRDERELFLNNYTSAISWDEWEKIYHPNSGTYQNYGSMGMHPDYMRYTTEAEAYLMSGLSNFSRSRIYEDGFQIKYASTGNFMWLEFDKALVSTGVNMGEGEQDVYSVSIPGQSFKFIIHPNTKEPIFVGEKSNCVIERTAEYNFIITDDKGTKYTFDQREETLQQYTNCWYLTRIEDMEGNWVEFTYENFGRIQPIPSFTEETGNIGNGCATSIRRVNTGFNDIVNLYLTRIETEKVLVKIILANDRIDLKGDGDRRLSSIEVNYKNSTDSESDDVTYFKYLLDNNNYFVGNTFGGDYLTDGPQLINDYTDEQLTHRLKFSALHKVNPITNAVEETYTFSYNENITLPRKTSFAIDNWGYFNGQSNNYMNTPEHTLLPKGFLFTLENDPDVPESFKTREGANRGMSKVNSKAAILNSITYPTGGKKVFEFEPHQFGYNKPRYLSAEDMKLIYPSDPVDYSVTDLNLNADTVASFYLDKTYEIHFQGSMGNSSKEEWHGSSLHGAFVKIVGMDPDNQDFEKIFRYNSLGADVQPFDEVFPVAEGNYKLSCYLPDGIYTSYTNIVFGTVKYQAFNDNLLLNAEAIGGGLRIKSVTDYDENNIVVQSTEYSYSGGRYLRPLLNYRKESFTSTTSIPSGCRLTSVTNHILSGTPYQPIVPINLPATVGYAQVAIKKVAKNGSDIGKEVAYFDNDFSVTMVFNRPFFSKLNAGKMIKRETYDKFGFMLRKSEFKYQMAQVDKTIINALFRNSACGDCDGLANQYQILVYLNTSYVNQLQSKTSTEYLNNNVFQNHTEYKYNKQNYVVSETTTTSAGDVTLTKYTYPGDIGFSSCISDRLQNLEDNNTVRDDCIIQTQQYRTTYNSCASALSSGYGDCLQTLDAKWNLYQDCLSNPITRGCQSENFLWEDISCFQEDTYENDATNNECCKENYLIPYFKLSDGCRELYPGTLDDECGQNPDQFFEGCLAANLIDIEQAFNSCINDMLVSFGGKPQVFASMISENMLNAPVEKQIWKGHNYGSLELVFSELNVYDEYTNTNGDFYYKPNSLLRQNSLSPIACESYEKIHFGIDQGNGKLIRDISYTTELIFDKYLPNKGKLLQYHKVNDNPVSYLWGYDHSYPIAKIENATYDQVMAALNTDDESLAYLQNYSESQLRAEMQKIRDNIPQAMVTSYTYDPQVGVTSITNENNQTTYYNYDAFNRLQYIKDFEGNVLQRYEYNYAD